VPGRSPLGEALGAHRRLAETFREEHARVLSVLVKQLRDLELAEDALGDAMAAAAERWPVDGMPRQPAGWLLAVARRRAIDRLRRAGTERRRAPLLIVPESDEPAPVEPAEIPDERLRLLFTACHPALSREAQVALTLRVVGGLTTGEIARAFLVSEPTMGQRISRAKRKIRDAGIPYAVPEGDELPPRLAAVRAVVYLIFNEGHTASTGARLQRVELQDEAIRLAALLHQRLGDDIENAGLLALLLLTAARAPARWCAGRPVPLREQDRDRWDRDRIARGLALVDDALAGGVAGPYLLQAAIAAEHARAPAYDATDWSRIVGWYDLLIGGSGDPVLRLNRAVARMERGDLGAALADIDALADELDQFSHYHAARAEVLTRLEHLAPARSALTTAIELTGNAPLRRELARRRDALH
jgi:RNA polymerase sigma-70 factor (ECF subfamily)